MQSEAFIISENICIPTSRRTRAGWNPEPGTDQFRYKSLQADSDHLGSKNPGPKDPALVIPRGDVVSWNLNGLWSIGVMECWENYLITD